MQVNVLFRQLAEVAGRYPTGPEQTLLREHSAYQGAIQGDPAATRTLTDAFKNAVAADAPAALVREKPSRHADEREFDGPVLLTARERKQAAVLSQRLARVAEQDDWPHVGVRQRRERLFGSQTVVSEADARALLASPILTFMTEDELAKSGIPIMGHQAQVTKLRKGIDEELGHWDDVSISVRWDGGSYEEKRRLPMDPWDKIRTRLLRVFGEDAVKHRLLDHRSPYLVFPDPKGWDQRLDVHPWSVFDFLSMTATRLAERIGWSEAAATWFILTGIVPTIPAVQVIGRRWPNGMEQVVVTALPSASRDTVAGAFSRAARRKLGHVVEERTSALVIFVDGKTEENGGTLPPWPVLWQAWKRERPKGCLGYLDYRDMRRTYARATAPRAKRRSIRGGAKQARRGAGRIQHRRRWAARPVSR